MNDKDNMKDVQIDIKQVLQNMVDKAMIDMLSITMPDEKTRKLFVGIMNVHRKYGIDPVTSIKIITDLGKITNQSDS